jgi:homoserine O-acetyltransferase
MRHHIVTAAVILTTVVPSSPAPQAQGIQGDFIARDVHFASGESMPEVTLHYTTLGKPRRDAQGVVRNAVMILHGTGGSGRGFLSNSYAGALFGPGKLLDTASYYVILPDNIGHGGSSKPSDGLHMRFPKYGYTDMVQLQHRLLTEGLQVNHLRLVMGTSMGCMHAWVWGYTYAEFADGLVPLACAPAQIAGRNRMMRRMILDHIMDDPDWKGGEYTTQPRGLRASLGMLFIMTSAPLVQQRQAPTRDQADSAARAYINSRVGSQDANDMLYQFDSSRDYDPSPYLEKVTAPVLAINSADDVVNPPELGIVERLLPRVPHARFILIPISPDTRGHGTHSAPNIWGKQLGEWLSTLPQR